MSKVTKAKVAKALKDAGFKLVNVKMIVSDHQAPAGRTHVIRDSEGKMLKAYETNIGRSPLDSTSIKTDKINSMINDMGSAIAKAFGVVVENHGPNRVIKFEGFSVYISEVQFPSYAGHLGMDPGYRTSYITVLYC